MIIEEKFSLGRVACSQKVNNEISKDRWFSRFVLDSLRRHASGDWGDLHKEDKKDNEYALCKNLKLYSAYEYYHYREREILIITEADRMSTSIQFLEEWGFKS